MDRKQEIQKQNVEDIPPEYLQNGEFWGLSWQQQFEVLRQLTSAREQIRAWEEREAACCPEDYGFDEVIKSLRKENARLEAQLAAATGKVQG